MTQPSHSLSVSLAKQIDQLCDQFEKAWKAGQNPKIEALLGDRTGSERGELLRALLELEMELELTRNVKPDPKRYKDRFPKDHSLVDAVWQSAIQRTTSHQPEVSKETSVSQSSAPSEPKKKIDPASLPMPKAIGRFQILSRLGHGAFGQVLLAHDPQINRKVAIKAPLRGALDDNQEIKRFLREARAAGKLHHPNICQVFEVGQTDKTPFIVMAYVDGQSLAAYLKDRKQPVSAKQAALIVRKLALALDAAHNKKVIHRDLKPSNIMFDRERKDLVIMDFGLARHVEIGDVRTTKEGTMIGSPAYMSPEQARGDVDAIGPHSDIYSLGVILYEMLAGRLPFQGSANEVVGQVLHVDPEPPSKFRKPLDKSLEAICLKAMAKEPGKRFESMKAFAKALNDYLRGSPQETAAAEETNASGEAGQFAQIVAALADERKRDSLRRKQEVHEAVQQAARGARIPLWQILTGAGVLAALIVIVLGIIFFTRTPTATILISIDVDDKYLNDAALTFFLDKKQVSAELLRKPVELTVGRHTLEIMRGEVLVRRYVFIVRGGNQPGINYKEIVPGPGDRPKKKTPTPSAKEKDGWVKLFNGKDLTGWKTVGGRDHWEVKDGILTAGGPRNYLFTERNDYTDFHLRAKVRIQPGGNSGICVRAEFAATQVLSSYEAQIAPAATPHAPNGSIYKRGFVKAKAENNLIADNTWFILEVIAEGPKITVKINGKTAATYVDNNPYTKGHIALQQHSPQTVVEFESIEIKEAKSSAKQGG